ncbi:P-loop containing nucleoside triphosphate hydrolase protein, partial [Baffinella frigidus]
QARIFVRGGDGGAGEVAFRREAHVDFGGPFGGNGGQGGGAVLEADFDQNSGACGIRRALRRERRAGGGRGTSPHTLLQPAAINIRTTPVVSVACGDSGHEPPAGSVEAASPGRRMVVATGGRGGRGNMAFRNAKETTPEYAELGEKGQERWLDMQMKLIADVGIVGVPNAGKSSLLAAVTNAKPKVADYPFTTVVPNLGVCHLPGTEFRTLVLADIPGLIDGAAQGTGLGQAFLRHIERCRVLVHMVDGSVEDPVEAFRCVQNELRQFSPELAEKPQVVLINKMDLPAVRAKFDQLRADLIIESVLPTSDTIYHIPYVPEIRNPKPESRIPKPCTRNPKPEFRNLEPPRGVREVR